MKISAVSNVNFKQNNSFENTPAKEDKTGLSAAAKTLIGVGVAAGTLAVYFIARNGKAAKAAGESLKKSAPAAGTAEQKAQSIIKDITPKEILEKTDKKIIKALEDFKSDFQDLSERLITPLKNGKTKVSYNGKTASGDQVKEVFVFGKDNEMIYRQTESMILERSMNQFPMEYTKSTKFTYPDGNVKSSETAFYLDMKPKQKVTTSNGNSKTVVYGYDLNGQPSGLAYTENDKVILKLYDKKFGQVYDSFENLFKNVSRDDFKKR